VLDGVEERGMEQQSVGWSRRVLDEVEECLME